MRLVVELVASVIISSAILQKFPIGKFKVYHTVIEILRENEIHSAFT